MKEIFTPDKAVIGKIYLVRGQKVMLDKNLSALYGVKTGNFNKAVQRTVNRFPDDFMFCVSAEERGALRFQIGILNSGRGRHTKYLPYAFTEQGVAMRSSVLNKDTAIDVNIRIIRIFTRMREMLLTHKDILLKPDRPERQVVQNSGDIQVIFPALKELLNPPTPPREPIGFKTGQSGQS